MSENLPAEIQARLEQATQKVEVDAKALREGLNPNMPNTPPTPETSPLSPASEAYRRYVGNVKGVRQEQNKPR